jgi:glycerol-3-phosphate dehydrogenase
MPDNKSQTDNRDRNRVAGGEEYEAQYLAQQTGISTEQARQLVKAYGTDRQTLLKAAKGLVSSDPKVRSSRV